MEGKADKRQVIKMEEYSLEKLFKDIFDSFERINNNADVCDKTKRECSHKIVVIKKLIEIALSIEEKRYKDDEILGKILGDMVKADLFLPGYMFYVSQNQRFDYSWTYLRKCQENYIKYLVEAIHFMGDMIADINVLARKCRSYRGLHVRFNNIIDVSLSEKKPYVKATVLWENFQGIADLSRQYNVSIMLEENVLFVGCRRDKSDIAKFIEKI